ncbi:serine/threonine-protein kinase PknK [Chondromyces crocatus]|uniref:Protein kinase n=1 Tax=Chondromyces crocatus TaxID=52 RepID=A0A0K1EHH5_CHOCO|nr:protein kinase [Chondromyces crocatus]AKT40315.1 protein kinase [Chondromyces crocatus]
MNPGDVLAERFVIERLAGAGGMGAVYRARDRLGDGLVALKVLLDPTRGPAARFSAEAQILAGLRHPGIVGYVAHGITAAGQPWLAMEWIEGEDLAERLERAPLSVHETIALGLMATEALETAHARGVVHRDIKPSNFILEGGDPRRPRLLDFGIARIDAGQRALTRTGVLMGTPGYLAPELARGELADARSDLFSLGAVLYECLAGRAAFTGSHVMALLARLLFEEVPPLRELRRDVPPALEALVTQLLIKDRAQRPESASRVLEALRGLVEADELPTRAMGERASGEASRPSQRDVDARVSSVPSVPGEGRALTTGERRVLSVVVASPEAVAFTLGETLPAEAFAARRQALERSVAPLGARVEVIASGAAVVMLEGEAGLEASDQAARAARCALGLQPVLAEWGGGGRIALVTGLSEVAGRLPVGPLLDRAAALLLVAGPRGAVVLIDETTKGLLDARFEASPARASLPAWELMGEREGPRGPRKLLGRPSPCVGRDRELQGITEQFEVCAREGAARAVVVLGPPGIGKSRLRDEVIRRARAAHPEVEVWIGRGVALGRAAAFGVVGSALRSATGMTGAEPLSARQEWLRAWVERHTGAPEPARVAAFLGEIAGIPFADDGNPALHAARQSPQAMAEQIRRAWEDVLGAVLSSHPLLLVLEDLHWGDAPSVRLLAQALSKHRRRPLFVLALSRPELHERFPRPFEEAEAQVIALGPLPRRAAEALCRGALGEGVASEKVSEIVERAAGNAFYLEELIRAVAEGRGEALPETVLAMVDARLGALDVEERRVLRAASVLGQVFWEGGVRRLLGEEFSSGGVLDALSSLCRKEVIERRDWSRLPGEQELSFRHALLREGAYASLTAEDRALGHRLAAAWLEEVGEGNAAVLAEHLERGGELGRAALYALRAGEALLQGGDLVGASAAAERGVACGAQGELLAELRRVLAEVEGWRGDPAASDVHVDEVLRLATPGSRAHCVALAGKVANALLLGQPGAMWPLLSGQLLKVEPAATAIGAFAWTLAIASEVLSVLTQRQLAAAHRTRLDRLAEALGGRNPLVTGWQRAAHGNEARLSVRDPWAALRLHREAAEAFATAGERRYEDLMRVRMATDLVHLGAPHQAEALLRPVLFANGGGSIQAKIGRLHLAFALAEQGRLDEGVEEARALAGSLSARSDWLVQGNAWLLAAQLSTRRGDVTAAEEAAMKGRELTRASPIDAAWADAVLAGVRLAQGRAEEAVALARAALQGSETLEVTHVLLLGERGLLAEALAAAGDVEGARAVIAEARDELLRRAARIEDPALRRSFVEGVSAHARIVARARAWLG